MQGTFRDADIPCHVARPVAHAGGDSFYRTLHEAMPEIVADSSGHTSDSMEVADTET